MNRAVAIVLLALLASPAAAHYFPGERAVLVQAEPGAAAILVSYRPPSGLLRDALELDARWSGLGRELVKAVLAARALAPLAVTLDGARLRPDEVRVKLAEDAPGRRVLAVLISARVPPGAHRLEVEIGESAERTTTQWLDRSGGRIVRFGPRPDASAFADRGTLVLEWGGTGPASIPP